MSGLISAAFGGMAGAIVSLLGLRLWYRERRNSSYRELIDAFNVLIDHALRDEDVSKIYEHIFYEKQLSDELLGSPKMRWACLRVLNVLEKYYVESHSGLLKSAVWDSAIDKIVSRLMKNPQFVEILNQANYSSKFTGYMHEVGRERKVKTTGILQRARKSA